MMKQDRVKTTFVFIKGRRKIRTRRLDLAGRLRMNGWKIKLSELGELL